MGIFLNRVGAPSSGKYQLDTAVATEAFMYEDYVDDCTYAYADLMETMAMVDGEVVTEAVGGIVAFITANLGKIIAFIVAVVAAIVAIIAAMKNGGGYGGSGKSDTEKQPDELNKKSEEDRKRREAEADRKKKEWDDKQAKKDKGDIEKNKTALAKLEADLNTYCAEYEKMCDKAIEDVKKNHGQALDKISDIKIPLSSTEYSLLGNSGDVRRTLDSLTRCIGICIGYTKQLPNIMDPILDFAKDVARLDPKRRNVREIIGCSEEDMLDELKEQRSAIDNGHDEYHEEFERMVVELKTQIDSQSTTHHIRYREISNVQYNGSPDVIKILDDLANQYRKLKDILEEDRDRYGKAVDQLLPKLKALYMVMRGDDKSKSGDDLYAGAGTRLVGRVMSDLSHYNDMVISLITDVVAVANSTKRYADVVKNADGDMKNLKTVAKSRLKPILRRTFSNTSGIDVLSADSVVRNISLGLAKSHCDVLEAKLMPVGSKQLFEDTSTKAKSLADKAKGRISTKYNQTINAINGYITDLGQYGFDTSDKLEKMSG